MPYRHFCVKCCQRFRPLELGVDRYCKRCWKIIKEEKETPEAFLEEL